MTDVIQTLIERFPEDIRYVYRNMIPAFQKSYASYIYQTPDIKIQERRIKNLAKSFRKNEKEPYHLIQPLSENELELTYHSDLVFELICNGERQLVYELMGNDTEVTALVWNLKPQLSLEPAENLIKDKLAIEYPELEITLKYH